MQPREIGKPSAHHHRRYSAPIDTNARNCKTAELSKPRTTAAIPLATPVKTAKQGTATQSEIQLRPGVGKKTSGGAEVRARAHVLTHRRRRDAQQPTQHGQEHHYFPGSAVRRLEIGIETAELTMRKGLLSRRRLKIGAVGSEKGWWQFRRGGDVRLGGSVAATPRERRFRRPFSKFAKCKASVIYFRYADLEILNDEDECFQNANPER